MTINNSFAANMNVGVSAQIPMKHSTGGEQHKPVCNGSYLYRTVREGEELQLAAV